MEAPPPLHAAARAGKRRRSVGTYAEARLEGRDTTRSADGSSTRRSRSPLGEASLPRSRRSASHSLQSRNAYPLDRLPSPAKLYVPSLPLLDHANMSISSSSSSSSGTGTGGGGKAKGATNAAPSSSSSSSSSSSHALYDQLRPVQYAGYLPARPPAPAPNPDARPLGNAHLYFVLQRAKHSSDRRRLVVWFNGGPGCSSFDGLMMEVGAFRADAGGGIGWAPRGGAWNEYADVLFLDQPVGTGFSYALTSAYAQTLQQAADEVVFFLRQFVAVYPEYAAGNGVDVYLAGESFAGQYIPYTANALLSAKLENREGGWPVDLRGIVIGNGIVDPSVQDGTELDMMVEAKIWAKDGREYKEVEPLVKECRDAHAKAKGNPRTVEECDSVLQRIIAITTQKSGSETRCINIYDVRLSDTSPACGMNWPPILGATYDYLKRADVRSALHVDEANKPEAWAECNHRVSSALHDASAPAASVHLPRLLDNGVRVLMFAGDQDLICNHIGVQRAVEAVRFGGDGAKPWAEEAKARDWYVDNRLAGSWREARNLSYVRVAQASHMVGFDKPLEAHDMLLRFMGVDLLTAAGPSARIPSRVEGEVDRMVVVGGGGGGGAGVGGGGGKGRVGLGGFKDTRPMIPGVDGKTEDDVREEAKWAAYYNAGSAALVILLILVATGVYVLLRLRRKARYERLAALGAGLGASRSGGGAGEGLGYAASLQEQHGHELQHLVVDQAGEEEEEDDDGNDATAVRRNDARYRPRYNDDVVDDDDVESAGGVRGDLGQTGRSAETQGAGSRREGARGRLGDSVGGATHASDAVARRDGEVLFGVGGDESD